MKPELAKKLSSEVHRALENPEHDPESRLNVLVTVAGALRPDQAQQLAELGAGVRTAVADVLTADLPIAAVPKLVALTFVRYVELSRTLRLE